MCKVRVRKTGRFVVDGYHFAAHLAQEVADDTLAHSSTETKLQGLS